MPGVPREVIEHCLNVKEVAKPIKQRLRRFAQDRKEAIRDELTKLTAANFIREVYHPDWLANLVLVKKKNGKWCMCVDYTDLNKACSKDPFGLPRIDQVVDSTAGSELLCFLDAYSGYHQVSLAESYCIKTSFITSFGAYCYITIPFDLRNAGATYQRAMQRCQHDQLGCNVEAYVDDVVIKSRAREDLISDLFETFTNLRRFRWKLNPEKCVFGVPSGKLLGFIVSYRGIEANPEKLKDIFRMNLPTKLKDAQKLTGCMVALSRFVSRLEERAMPFYKLLKKQDKFQWTSEAQQALDKLNEFLTSPP